MYLTREAVNVFMKQESRGAIVNIASTSAVRGGAAGIAYTASKHAALGISRSTAWAYAKDGIRTNAVLPGGVNTNILKSAVMDQKGYDSLASYIDTLPKFSQAINVARAVIFLASTPDVNGAELSVDNGWLTI